MYGWSNRGKSGAGRYIFFGRGGRIIRSSRFSFSGRRALSGFLSAGISGIRVISGFLSAGIPGRRAPSAFLLMSLVRGRNIGGVFVACFRRSSCIGGVSNINRAGRTYITLIMNFYKIAVFCNKSIVLEI